MCSPMPYGGLVDCYDPTCPVSVSHTQAAFKVSAATPATYVSGGSIGSIQINPFAVIGIGTTQQASANNTPPKEHDCFMELITERVYRISSTDYANIIHHMSSAYVYPLTMELEERIIDYHTETKNEEGKPIYKYNAKVKKTFVVAKILWIYTEPKA